MSCIACPWENVLRRECPILCEGVSFSHAYESFLAQPPKLDGWNLPSMSRGCTTESLPSSKSLIRRDGSSRANRSFIFHLLVRPPPLPMFAPCSKGEVPCVGHLGRLPLVSRGLPHSGHPLATVLMCRLSPKTAFFSIAMCILLSHVLQECMYGRF